MFIRGVKQVKVTKQGGHLHLELHYYTFNLIRLQHELMSTSIMCGDLP